MVLDGINMKNKDKYLSQIVNYMASGNDGFLCDVFSPDPYECINCHLHGYCTNKDKLMEWMLKESDDDP